MSDLIVIDMEVDDDGRVVLEELPPGRHIRITIEEVAEPDTEQAELDAELKALFEEGGLHGRGLTAEEILQSPAIGIWKDREDMQDPVAYLAEMRRKRRERHRNGD